MTGQGRGAGGDGDAIRRTAVGVLAWCGAVVTAGWLSWLAIDSAGRQVVAPLPATAAGSTATASTSTPSTPTPSTTPSATSSTPPVSMTSPSSPAALPRTVTTRAGTAAATCAGGSVDVLYATPLAGWRASVKDDGEHARVEFRSGDERVRLDLTCGQGGVEVKEDDHGGSGGAGADD
ncbi:MAG TPA: hypothetical protein VFX33_09645 [Actinomycetales bacterium]|nr:hypothetical protein [Actinomycetales bacterium]